MICFIRGRRMENIVVPLFLNSGLHLIGIEILSLALSYPSLRGGNQI